jgi:hypothetical protein
MEPGVTRLARDLLARDAEDGDAPEGGGPASDNMGP